ncbi:MAG: glycosyltransferase family 4 protein [Candidatus Bathycorpusculaceae bacterium]
MNILFIMNGIGAVRGFPGISGGDVRWIEIAKFWREAGYNIHVLTPEAGIKLCKKLGLDATFHIFNVPNDYSLKTYLLKFVKSIYIPKTLENFHGIIYSTTEHVYDVCPAVKIKENSEGNIWIAVVHWVAPLKRKGTNWLNSILFFFNQQMGFRYIKNRADLVLAVSKITAEHVKRRGIKHNVFSVDCGVAYQEIRQVAAKVKSKRYEAVFMKRFDGTKGVFDIVEIWKEVVKIKPEAKLGMMGLGTKKVMDKLRSMVRNYNLQDNVDFLGSIYDFETKISLLASSKLFVLPSYEENWAIVIGEAMAAGTPVLCYDLSEIRPIWGDNVVWVPKGDKKKFANKIIEFLDSEQARNRLSEAGIRFIKRYDWQKIADEEMKLILSIGNI